MAMLDNLRSRNPDPKAAEAPRPARSAPESAPRVYDDDVLAQFQRFKDLQTETARLQADCDEWRRRALAAESECTRLQARSEEDRRLAEAELDRLDARRQSEVKALTAELDYHKGELTRVITLANAGASVFLRILDQGRPAAAADAAARVGLAAIADAIDKPAEPQPQPLAQPEYPQG